MGEPKLTGKSGGAATVHLLAGYDYLVVFAREPDVLKNARGYDG
jgi:hypothetical protein